MLAVFDLDIFLFCGWGGVHKTIAFERGRLSCCVSFPISISDTFLFDHGVGIMDIHH
jgi:hypothetical protein